MGTPSMNSCRKRRRWVRQTWSGPAPGACRRERSEKRRATPATTKKTGAARSPTDSPAQEKTSWEVPTYSQCSPWLNTIMKTARPRTASTASMRSEEHTSELQSRENLVCRLLLEKKKLQYL